MSRKRQRVQFSLDAGGIKVLNDVEIKMILRAADELILGRRQKYAGQDFKGL